MTRSTSAIPAPSSALRAARGDSAGDAAAARRRGLSPGEHGRAQAPASTAPASPTSARAIAWVRSDRMAVSGQTSPAMARTGRPAVVEPVRTSAGSSTASAARAAASMGPGGPSGRAVRRCAGTVTTVGAAGGSAVVMLSENAPPAIIGASTPATKPKADSGETLTSTRASRPPAPATARAAAMSWGPVQSSGLPSEPTKRAASPGGGS
jgi:hypothetical protein